MPILLERLESEPIIIARCIGRISASDFQAMYADSAALIRDDDLRVWRITDLRDWQTDFNEVLAMARNAASGLPGSTTDPRLSVVMVGRDNWAKLFNDFIRQEQYAGLYLPFFKSMDTALAYVRMEIGRLKQVS